MTVKIVLALWFTIRRFFLFFVGQIIVLAFSKANRFCILFSDKKLHSHKIQPETTAFFMRVYKRWRGYRGLWNGEVGVFFFFTWFMWHMLAVFLCKVSAIDVKHLLQISYVLCDLFLFHILQTRKLYTYLLKVGNKSKKRVPSKFSNGSIFFYNAHTYVRLVGEFHRSHQNKINHHLAIQINFFLYFMTEINETHQNIKA